MAAKIFYQPQADYHKDRRVSKSALDQLARSPAHYKAWLEAEEDDPTPAMIFGSLYHCMALEPGTFHSRFAIIPEDAPSKQGKANKEWWEKYLMAHKGLTLIKKEDHDIAKDMVSILMEHSRAQRIIKDAMIEWSIYGKLFGIDCKIKPDILNRGYGVVADLKSAASAEYPAFQRAIANFRYHVQASFYMDLADMASPGIYEEFCFIVQEKTPPYGIRIYRASPEMLRRGRIEYAFDLEAYKECQVMDHWPCYPEEITTIDLPAWA